MKKRKLNDLSLKKKTISNLQTPNIKGGNPEPGFTSLSGSKSCWDECQWSWRTCNTTANCGGRPTCA